MPPRVMKYAKEEAAAADIAVSELLSRDRRHKVATARRKVAVRLSNDGFSNCQIASWMGLDPSTVHYYMQGKMAVSRGMV